MKIYNKLIRDKIPQIISDANKSFDTHVATKEEYTIILEAKLNEEVSEYLEDKNLEELADIMEVIFALAKNLGYSEDDLIQKRNEKRDITIISKAFCLSISSLNFHKSTSSTVNL